MNGPETNHLTPEDFYYFIEEDLEGPRKGWVERHLISCQECLELLDHILLAEVPGTIEEEAVLGRLSRWSVEELLGRLCTRVLPVRADRN